MVSSVCVQSRVRALLGARPNIVAKIGMDYERELKEAEFLAEVLAESFARRNQATTAFRERDFAGLGPFFPSQSLLLGETGAGSTWSPPEYFPIWSRPTSRRHTSASRPL